MPPPEQAATASVAAAAAADANGGPMHDGAGKALPTAMAFAAEGGACRRAARRTGMGARRAVVASRSCGPERRQPLPSET